MDNLSQATPGFPQSAPEGSRINQQSPQHTHAEQPLPQSWVRRNIVAVVIGGVLLFVVLLTGCIGGMIYFGISALGSHSSVQTAVQQAAADPRVVERLGSPVEKGWFVTGNVSVINGQQSANMQVAVKGPRDKGKLHYTGAKGVGGNWVFSELTLVMDGQPSLNLLTPQPLPGSPGTPGTLPSDPTPDPATEPDDR